MNKEPEGEVSIFYVSPGGSNNNPGTKKKPFRTIEKVRDTIREEGSCQKGNVYVYLRGGEYEIDETIKLNEKDSGRNGYWMTYKNYPGEKPVISGGKKITSWLPFNHNSCNMWRASVPYIENTRQLYIGGDRAVRARSKSIESKAWEKLADPDMKFDGLLENFEGIQGTLPVFEGYISKNAEMLKWRNHSDIEFVYDVGWTHSICPVDKITSVENGIFIKMKMPCFRDCQIKGGVQIGSPNYIENAFELLSEQGQWYLDRTDHIIYYIPKNGEDIKGLDAKVPVVEQLLEIKGNIDEPVCNIKFEGIAFEYTTWLRPSVEGHPEVQANLLKDSNCDYIPHSKFIKVPSAIIIDAAESVTFEKCSFCKFGSGAIDIQNGSKYIFICENVFFDIAATAIQVGGFNLTDAHPDDERMIVRNNRISDNYFHDIGTEYKGSTAVNAGYVRDIEIVRNEICNIAYSGISIGWGWGFWDVDGDKRTEGYFPEHYPHYNKPTVMSNNRIEYNHIHHVMQKLHDGAGIYTLSMQENSTIKGNLIHDNGKFINMDANEDKNRQGWPGGIYLDEASGGFEVTGNIVYNVANAYYYNHSGIPGRVESNNVHGNTFNIVSDGEGFPDEIADKAGLEGQYRNKIYTGVR